MPSSETVRTRSIARAAVKAELAAVAYRLFSRQGFDGVTIDDLATEAGVSRSTFLRYFATKEDAVLTAVDACAGTVAEGLRERPRTEDDWTALRRSLDEVLRTYGRDSADALARTRLIWETPALRGRLVEKQHAAGPELTRTLAARRGAGTDPTLTDAVLVAAALDCLLVAVGTWLRSGGEGDLVALLDEAFSILRPAGRSRHR